MSSKEPGPLSVFSIHTGVKSLETYQFIKKREREGENDSVCLNSKGLMTYPMSAYAKKTFDYPDYIS